MAVEHRQPPAIRNPIPCKKQKHEEPPSPAEVARGEIERHEEQIAQLQADVLRLEDEVQTLLSQLFCLKRFEGSDSDIQFYTGLPSNPVFMCLYRYLEPLLCHLRLCRSDVKSTSTQTFKPRARALQPIDELFLVLRLGLLEQDLAHRFNIGIATVSRICVTWIKFLDQQFRPLITWPSRAVIDTHMPAQFKEFYPSTRVIILWLGHFQHFTGIGSFLDFARTPHFLGSEVELGPPLFPWVAHALLMSSTANINAAV